MTISPVAFIMVVMSKVKTSSTFKSPIFKKPVLAQLKRQCAYFRYGCVALLSGAVGNLIDRIRSGLVVDFFDFRIWPVFNIADIAIVLGVVSMIYAILYKEKEMDE